MELSVILALLLRSFTFRIEARDAADIRFEETITLQPKHLNVVLIPRR
jgi:hypothetical protein